MSIFCEPIDWLKLAGKCYIFNNTKPDLSGWMIQSLGCANWAFSEDFIGEITWAISWNQSWAKANEYEFILLTP